MKPFRSLARSLQRASLGHHGLAALGTLVLLASQSALLNWSYAASNHPVGFAEGQTTFSATKIKGFYAVMQEAGTLDRYWQTQLLDFGLIIAMAVSGIAVGTFAARLNAPQSIFARAARLAALLICGGTIFDSIENLLSFVMLAQPQGFPDWLALPYSTAAVIKFALISAGLIALVLAFAAALVRRFAHRPPKSNRTIGPL